MRSIADASHIHHFMRDLGRAAKSPASVYFTGGASAVLSGWRDSTIDIDIKIVPEDDRLLRAIPELKEALHINVELAAPLDFIPVADAWEDRSPFVAQEGTVTFRHFDFVAQALAKVERGHAQDREDVAAMLARGLVTTDALRKAFAAIQPMLYRYPAVNPASFQAAVDDVLR